uniref:Uncharacterized protein n=2 Tax=Meloidogyne TaxID=189290 RepID=A0A6V7V0K0_MELEN|nr:unnamed protein product [Meloidogyne enterolobii]
MAKARVIEKLDYLIKKEKNKSTLRRYTNKEKEKGLYKMKFDKMVLNKMAHNKKVLG